MHQPPTKTRPHDWPQYDPKMMREYGGTWVAVTGQECLGNAATPDLALVAGRAEAERRNIDPDGVRVFAVCKPEDAWF